MKIFTYTENVFLARTARIPCVSLGTLLNACNSNLNIFCVHTGKNISEEKPRQDRSFYLSILKYVENMSHSSRLHRAKVLYAFDVQTPDYTFRCLYIGMLITAS